MADLIESGRSKVDVEISYSSSNHQTAPLSIAEFANSRQEPLVDVRSRKQNPLPQGDQQYQHHNQQQQQQHQHDRLVSDESQPAWSTKLRSVPLSLEFNVSVFATQDRHGRLTLHPVLRTAEVATVVTASQQPFLTSRAVAQSLTLCNGGGGSSSCGGGICSHGSDGGDLGRNNCAKASLLTRCPQLERSWNSRPQQHLLVHCQQMAETDISTATRASCSVGTATENSAAQSVIAAASITVIAAESAAAAATAAATAGTTAAATAGTTAAASTAPKAGPKIKSNSRKQAHLIRHRRISATCAEPNLRRSVICTQQHQDHCSGVSLNGAGSCRSSGLTVPSPVKAISSQSDSVCHQRLLGKRSQLSSRSLTRIVQKLESLLDSIYPHIRAQVTETSVSAMATATATDDISCGNTSRTGGGCRGTKRTQELPRNNLDLADLRQEYVVLFCD